MPSLTWQKSTYSAEAANCVYLAAGPTRTVHLRESDTPETILTASPTALHTLIRTLKAGGRPK